MSSESNTEPNSTSPSTTSSRDRIDPPLTGWQLDSYKTSSFRAQESDSDVDSGYETGSSPSYRGRGRKQRNRRASDTVSTRSRSTSTATRRDGGSSMNSARSSSLSSRRDPVLNTASTQTQTQTTTQPSTSAPHSPRRAARQALRDSRLTRPFCDLRRALEETMADGGSGESHERTQEELERNRDDLRFQLYRINKIAPGSISNATTGGSFSLRTDTESAATSAVHRGQQDLVGKMIGNKTDFNRFSCMVSSLWTGLKCDDDTHSALRSAATTAIIDSSLVRPFVKLRKQLFSQGPADRSALLGTLESLKSSHPSLFSLVDNDTSSNFSAAESISRARSTMLQGPAGHRRQRKFGTGTDFSVYAPALSSMYSALKREEPTSACTSALAASATGTKRSLARSFAGLRDHLNNPSARYDDETMRSFLDEIKTAEPSVMSRTTSHTSTDRMSKAQIIQNARQTLKRRKFGNKTKYEDSQTIVSDLDGVVT